MKNYICIWVLWIAMAVNTSHAAGLYPVSGWYWNPEKPGTGFNIKLQRGSFKEDGWIFAAGYVYDEAGNPTFITLQGEYRPYTWQQIRDADGRYIGTMTSEAYVSTGGQCIGCPYTPANTQADNSLGPVELRFTDLDAVEIRFKNDTWELQVMDWHDDPPLSEVFDPFRSREQGLEWNVRGIIPFAVNALRKLKMYPMRSNKDLASYGGHDLYGTFGKVVSMERKFGVWDDNVVAYNFAACDISSLNAWSKEFVMELMNQDIYSDFITSCRSVDLNYMLSLYIFTGPDGKLWFHVGDSIDATFISQEEAQYMADNLFSSYGGVVGRLYTSRNDFVGIGLYKSGDFFPQRMGMELVFGEPKVFVKDSEIKSTFIHWYRGAIDPERYGDDDLVLDTFWETGSIFGNPWTSW